jgi:hypothetical protein
VGAHVHGDIIWWLITQDNYQAFALQYERNDRKRKTYCAAEITNSAVAFVEVKKHCGNAEMVLCLFWCMVGPFSPSLNMMAQCWKQTTDKLCMCVMYRTLKL